MNLVQLQDQLKNFSQQQLVSEMQRPSGQMPQFLILTELNRRKRMMEQQQLDAAQGDQQTVAQDLVAVAGMSAAQAGHMSRALAPATDMSGNTGMPMQAQPQAPQRMREGGIVALQEGGPVRRPQVVVRNGRQFAQMGDGSLIPLSDLGFSEADLAGAGTADLAGPFTPAPSPVSGGNMGIGSVLAQGFDPGIRMPMMDFTAASDLAGRDTLPAMLRADRPRVPAGIASLGGNFEAPTEIYGDVVSPTSRREPRAPSAPTEDPLARLTATPAIPGLRVEGDPMAGANYAAPWTQLGPRLSRALIRLQGSGEVDVNSPEFARLAAEDPVAAANILESARAQAARLAEADAAVATVTRPGVTTGSPLAAVTLPGDASPTPAEAQEQNAQAAAQQAAAERAGPTGPSGGGGGGGGGGAAGSAAPGSFEEFIQQRIQNAEADRRRDQWLALAQFGLQLMASDSPTLGGAIGEAGSQALESLRGSYQNYNDTMMELYGTREQLRARRAGGGGGGGGGGGAAPSPFGGLSTDQGRLLGQYESEIARLDTVLSGATGALTPAIISDATARRDALIAERQMLVSAMSGVPFGALAAPSNTFDVR